jgi:hypothetical protein
MTNLAAIHTFQPGASSMSRRIRDPHPNDVLAGRGGGVNAHPGNIRFRDWVLVRREAYTLAVSKSDKMAVAQQVVALVQAQDPPGRFLVRDPSAPVAAAHHSGTSGWWIELDEEKIMAKTSQALREGAPSIRAAHGQPSHHHKKENQDPRATTSKRTLPLGTTAPLAPTAAAKRVRLDYQGRTVLPSDLPSPKLGPQLVAPDDDEEDDGYALEYDAQQGEHFSFPLPALPSYSETGPMKRSHSLALSEISVGDLDFVNPFHDDLERGWSSRLNATWDALDRPDATPLQPLERAFSTQSQGDMGGIGALLRSNSEAALKPNVVEDSLEYKSPLDRFVYDEFLNHDDHHDALFGFYDDMLYGTTNTIQPR